MRSISLSYNLPAKHRPSSDQVPVVAQNPALGGEPLRLKYKVSLQFIDFTKSVPILHKQIFKVVKLHDILCQSQLIFLNILWRKFLNKEHVQLACKRTRISLQIPVVIYM